MRTEDFIVRITVSLVVTLGDLQDWVKITWSKAFLKSFSNLIPHLFCLGLFKGRCDYTHSQVKETWVWLVANPGLKLWSLIPRLDFITKPFPYKYLTDGIFGFFLGLLSGGSNGYVHSPDFLQTESKINQRVSITQPALSVLSPSPDKKVFGHKNSQPSSYSKISGLNMALVLIICRCILPSG